MVDAHDNAAPQTTVPSLKSRPAPIAAARCAAANDASCRKQPSPLGLWVSSNTHNYTIFETYNKLRGGSSLTENGSDASLDEPSRDVTFGSAKPRRDLSALWFREA